MTDRPTARFLPRSISGAVSSLTPEDLDALGIESVVIDAISLFWRTGFGVVSKLGGARRMMGWAGEIVLDPGIETLASLADPDQLRDDSRANRRRRVSATTEGLSLVSPLDGSVRLLSPEAVADFAIESGCELVVELAHPGLFAANPAERDDAARLTNGWTERIARRLDCSLGRDGSKAAKPRLLGAIVWGERESLLSQAERLLFLAADLPAIAGVAVFGLTTERLAVDAGSLSWLLGQFPFGWERLVSGVGTAKGMGLAQRAGANRLTSVAPVRLAKEGKLYSTSPNNPQDGIDLIDISEGEYSLDSRPLIDGCLCPTCQRFSRAYLNHLFRANELLGYRLATLHNLWYISALLDADRRSDSPEAEPRSDELLAESVGWQSSVEPY